MKERPILFNSTMIKAILEGRKTQTRRIMRRQPDAIERYKRGEPTSDTDAQFTILRCYKNPKGFRRCASGWSADAAYKTPFSEFNVGDRLWVRETWHVEPGVTGWSMDENEPCIGWIEYKAGGSKEVTAPNFDAVQRCFPKGDVDWDFLPSDWRPSIFMPRWASRILLEITNISVERLNDISEEDSIAEGVESVVIQDNISVEGGWTRADRHMWKGYKNKERAYRDTAKDSFTSLWQEINGSDSWTQNPWVWVVEFKVIQGGEV